MLKEQPNLQIGYRLWVKLLDEFLKANKGRCGQQLKFTMNAS
jgi:hypothetical protein